MGAAEGLTGVSWSAPGFSHVQAKTRPLKAVQRRRTELWVKVSLIFLNRKSIALCSEGKLQSLLGYFVFFSILRVFIVYSLEQVPCGSCQRAGWRDLLTGERGSDNLSPSAGANQLSAIERNTVGPVTISWGFSPWCFPRKYEFVMCACARMHQDGNKSGITYSMCIC